MSESQTLYSVIKKLYDKKIKIWLEGEALKFKAPKGVLDAELKNQMIQNICLTISFIDKTCLKLSSCLGNLAWEILPRPTSAQEYSEYADKHCAYRHTNCFVVYVYARYGKIYSVANSQFGCVHACLCSRLVKYLTLFR